MDTNYDDIYRACLLIHKLTKLNIEFIPAYDTIDEFPPFTLSIQQVPDALKAYYRTSINFIAENLKHDGQIPINIYHHTDNLMTSYLAISINKSGGHIGSVVIGPFLNDVPNDEFISNIMHTHNFPSQMKDVIYNYYKALNILNVDYCKNIGHIIINLLYHPFIECNMKNFLLSSNHDIINEAQREEMLMDLSKAANEIEMRYRYEKVLLKAIEEGNKEKALQIRNFIKFDPSYRTPANPLRAHKNILFSINTMFRLAAERGGVPPLYLHNLSDKFAILIEKTFTYPELENIVTRMICEYCELVQKKSMIGYSRIVKKTIEYINLNFKEPISLKLLAQHAGVNPSHLSRQFKKELGIGITEFINKRRIEEAKFLMIQGRGSITDIAISVGFESYNYFYRVFKKMTSITPKDFIKQYGKSSQG